MAKRNKLNEIKRLINGTTLWHTSCSISRSKHEKGDRKMNKIITTLGIVLLAGVIAIPVLAHGPGWGRGRHMMGDWGNRTGYSSEYGRGHDRMNEDQRNQLDKLNKSYYDEIAQLRSQLWDKSEEINSLLNSSNPDVDKARAIQKEISELRAKLDQVRIDFEFESNKINPDLRFGHGYGRGRRGDRGTETCW